MQIASRPVGATEVSTLIDALRRTTTHPVAGLFGPDSINWRINRESALFLGAGRASLLQLAHPWVCASLQQHSNLQNDPLERFHHTFRIVFAMVFGTLDQALAASRYLHRRHESIRGELPGTVAGWSQGAHYEANDLDALIWVFATLVDSAVIAHDAVLTPLTGAEREIYYNEAKRFAALFGIPAHALPADWSAFQTYLQFTLQSPQLGVDDSARELAHDLLHGRNTWVPVPRWYRALTAMWLPESLNDAFKLPYGPDEFAAADRALRRIRRIYPHLPAAVRFVGPYREALSRLAGRRPGPLVLASNRFWTGRLRILFRAETASSVTHARV